MYPHATVSSAPFPLGPSKPWLFTAPVVFVRVAAVVSAFALSSAAVEPPSFANISNQYRFPAVSPLSA